MFQLYISREQWVGVPKWVESYPMDHQDHDSLDMHQFLIHHNINTSFEELTL